MAVQVMYFVGSEGRPDVHHVGSSVRLWTAVWERRVRRISEKTIISMRIAELVIKLSISSGQWDYFMGFFWDQPERRPERWRSGHCQLPGRWTCQIGRRGNQNQTILFRIPLGRGFIINIIFNPVISTMLEPAHAS